MTSTQDVDKLIKPIADAYRGLVFEAGSTSGTSHAGAYRALDELGVLQGITHFGGSSIGSSMAIFGAVRIPSEGLIQEVLNADMVAIRGQSTPLEYIRLLDKFGLYSGDGFRVWCEGILEKYTGQRLWTFKQVHDTFGTCIRIESCCLNKISLERYSHETTPDMIITDAVQRSTALPFEFTNVVDGDQNHFADSGIVNPYPIDIFDDALDPTTVLGVKLINHGETRDFIMEHALPVKIDSFSHYILSILYFLTVWNDRSNAKRLGYNLYWERSICLTSLSLLETDFDIPKTQRQTAINTAYTDTIDQLSTKCATGKFDFCLRQKPASS